MKRALGAACWALPPILLFTVYWLGLWIWFYLDDFAWLKLNLRLAESPSLWRLLLEPAAQGTIRPLSERLFFIGFYQWFGLDAFPYRLLVYATHGASLILLALVARRLTGSRLAAFWAPVFWTVNVGTLASLSWTSTYNQILCAYLLLLAFHFFLLYAESGRARYYALQWAVFLLGFGVLEMNAVYPAIAFAYALVRAQKYLLHTLPLFAVSGAYAFVHNMVAPKAASGPYAMHLDLGMAATLWKYWTWSLGGVRLAELFPQPVWIYVSWAGTGILTLAVWGFVLSRLLRRDWLAGFSLVWFLILLAPVLPLRDHFSGYYLTLPAIGLALLGGWAFALAWTAGPKWKGAAILAAGLYLGMSLPVGQAIVTWNFERGRAARQLILGVGRAQQLHPGTVILLTGVDSDLFWTAMKDKPFSLVGAPHVYLAPGSEKEIRPHPEIAEVGDYVLSARPARRLLASGEAVVYDASRPRLRNITGIFRTLLDARGDLPFSRRIDAGQPWFAEHFMNGWQPIERGYRWMGRRAALRLGGPRTDSEHLYVSGFCPDSQVREGPLRLTVTAEGSQTATVEIGRGDAGFDFRFPLAPELVGRQSFEVILEVSRTFYAPGEPRELGLAFGTFAVR